MYAALTDRELEIIANNTSIAEQTNAKVDYKDKVCVKPWGYEFLIYQNNRIAIWCVNIKNRGETSLHCHFKKDTLLITLDGNAKITFIDGSVYSLSVLQPLFIPRYKFHSLSSFSNDTVIMEIEIFNDELSFSDKNDLLRIQDPFKREKTGYEKSVQIETNDIEKWGYFYLNNFFTTIGHTSINTQVIKDNEFKIKHNSVNILLEGEVFINNQYLREGSIITNTEHVYTLSKQATVLTLQNLNIHEDKKIIYTMDHLSAVLKYVNTKNIILTSGCFDILHIGHLHSLRTAKSLGDILIVCLSNDDQIKKLKGATRPVNNYKDRINLFKTITYVDYIVLYEETDIVKEETLDKIIQIVNPLYWVKGSDYTKSDILSKHPSIRNIYLIDNIQNVSSTHIIEKITNFNK
jgi:rfaE bifunctional protein nucleotidyltransferase chain/domain